ncbi:L-fuconolactone hydrolase [Vibrio variabilis]|uniref:L-fuconolactone hydrolase n=1 Tax=Vibrio variabilis TaxID=990271 RepID=A0ABQ0J6M7_9VIBR|nr:L-fuconolactone hydrolase [Vibrio variabilis]
MKYMDSQLHLWNTDKLNYDWLALFPEINKPHTGDMYFEASDNKNITGSIFVQADCDTDQALSEVDWVNEVAEHNPNISLVGIVAWAPLHLGDKCLNYLKALLEHKRVVGVRHSLQNSPIEMFYDEDYRKGVLVAARNGLVIDMCVRGYQLEALNDLLTWLFERYPEAHVVLSHCGKPNIKEAEFDSWLHSITKIASFKNVFCKISGLPTEADWINWKEEQLIKYINEAVNIFSPQRCMYGSDWPVVNLAGGVNKWKKCVAMSINSLNDNDKKSIWYETTQRAYRV